MPGSTSGAVARKALGVIRLTFGTVALTAPQVLMHRFSGQDAAAATYAFRMFGVRTVIIGLELLLLKGAGLERAVNVAPIIHASDTVAALIAARSGQLPQRTGAILVAVSAVNTVLSLIGRRR
ncbi:MAG: hypothetical protein JWO49_1212 [Arthrobacter sp.]|nr:hypothetical protein [Arthrobacter sp.]MCU1548624.1 hypothetical protein [Arthrobacter sp.]